MRKIILASGKYPNQSEIQRFPSGVRQVPALSDGCQKARLIRAHADAQMACESQRVSQRQRRVGRSPIEISGWGGAGSVYSLFL